MNDLDKAEYWVEVDPETKEPTGHICWAYYADDRPIVGYWIKVRETGANNQSIDIDPKWARERAARKLKANERK